MRKAIIGITLAVILVAGAMAYAHGPGGWGGGGPMMGQGQGYGQMMGQGYGGHMMRRGGGFGPGADPEFLNETADLRKEMHNKRFEYMEAVRNPETTDEAIVKLEKEIDEIRTTILEKAPRGSFGRGRGYGQCW